MNISRPCAERDAAICAAARTDPSIRVSELCARFNTGAVRVYNILAKAGVKRVGVKRPRLSPCAERDAEIVAFVLSNPDSTYVQIGEKFGLTYRHVHDILRHAGMRKPRSKKGNPAGRERNAVVAMMAADGVPQKQIAAELNLYNVSSILKTYDPEWQNRRSAAETVRAERDAKVVAMVLANPAMTSREIAAKLGMTTGRVHDIYRDAGLTKPRISWERVDPVTLKRNEMILNFVKDNPELTCDQVGEKWGISGPGVFYIIKQAGISKPRVYQQTECQRDRDELIGEMRRDGLQLKDIAAQLGMSRAAVYSVIVRRYPELQPKRNKKEAQP